MIHGSTRQFWRSVATITIGASFVAGCAPPVSSDAAAQRLADREEIEQVLARANLGFELSDPDLFANAFAPDAVYELPSDVPVFGYAKLRYDGACAATTATVTRSSRSRGPTRRSTCRRGSSS